MMNMHIEAVTEDAKRILTSAKGSHDWDHTERVRRLCMRIGRKEKADLAILEIAAILHDIGRGYEDRTNGRVCHAEKGASMARKILAKHSFSEDEIEKIAHCIETHRFRGNKVPQSKEAKVLFDADKLDSIGAVGIGRAFLFAGEIGARLHNSDTEIEKTKQYTREDTAYREFMVKLKKVRARMLTREGRRIAEERHEFMVGFFARMNKEVSGKL